MKNFKKVYVLIPLIYLVIITALTLVEKDAENSNIKSFMDAIWYSIVTLTTVGYGDFYPVTPLGKFIGLTIIIASLGLLGYLIGGISNIIRNYMEKKKDGFYGTKFENHFVIIGWDDFAKQVAQQVTSAGHQVAIAVDNKNYVDIIHELFTEEQVFVLFTDLAHTESFKKLNIEQASTVYINLNDDSKSLVFIINMKKVFGECNYVISLNNSELKETFKNIGVNHTIAKNDIASKLVASYIFEPDVAKLTEDFMTTSVSAIDYDIQEYLVIDSNPYLNKDYFEVYVELKKKHNAVLLGLVKIDKDDHTRRIIKNPQEGEIIELNDYLLLVSEGSAKINLKKIFGVNEGVIHLV